MPKYRHSIFRGTMVKYDLVDMNKEFSPDCGAVDITRKGELGNMPGTEKQVTTGFDDAVMAVHQIDDDEFVIEGGTVQKL